MSEEAKLATLEAQLVGRYGGTAVVPAQVVQGGNSSKELAHLQVHRVFVLGLSVDSFLEARINVYISYSGIVLLNLFERQRQVPLERNVAGSLFFELTDGGSDQSPSSLKDDKIELFGAITINTLSAESCYSSLSFLFGPLLNAVTYHGRPLKHELKDLFANRTTNPSTSDRFALAGGVYLQNIRFFGKASGWLLKAFAALATTLEPKLALLSENLPQAKMPEAIWKPDARPQDTNAALASVGKHIDRLKGILLDALNAIPEIQIFDAEQAKNTASINEHIFYSFLLDIQNFFNRTIHALRLIVNFFEKNHSAQGDSFMLLGYISGLWDGLIDAVSGIVELISLIFNALSKAIAKGISVDTLIAVFRESGEEISPILSNVEIDRLLRRFLDVWAPKIWTYFKERAEYEATAFVRDSAQMGYHMGYFVYNIAENFLPPLKFTKVSKISESAVLNAKFFSSLSDIA